MTGSWLAIALLASGTILLVLMLARYTGGKRYLRPPKPDRGVGFVQDKLDAEETLASLAPIVMEAADREKAVTGSLNIGRPLDQESRRNTLKLLREADVSGLWRGFGTASSLIEDDPQMARDELEALSASTQIALDRLSEAEGICERPEPQGPAGIYGGGTP